MGLVARSTARGRVILCYFFGPYTERPTAGDFVGLTRKDAVAAIIVGDLALIEGTWPVIGDARDWARNEWPMPMFVRREPVSGRIWRVYRSDTNPNKMVKQELATDIVSDQIRNDAVYGYGAAEDLLEHLFVGHQVTEKSSGDRGIR